MRRTLFILAAAGLFAATQVHADAEVVYMTGDVRSDRGPVAQGQRISPGTTLTTGPGARAELHFSDRQRVLLGEDTAFRIAAFHYVAREPQADRASFELRRGSVRLVSGAVGSRNPGVVALQIPQASLSLRGTDFMVALVNPAYVRVLEGAVSVTTNAGGTVVFGTNSAARVTSASAVAQPVFIAALPPAASRPFSSLAAAPARAPAVQAAAPSTTGAPVSPPAAGSTQAPATRAAASSAAGAAVPVGSAPSPSAAGIGKSALLGVWAALLVGALASDSTASHQ
jgi:hypothetical protein